MVSDVNENWYLGVFWSEELVGALNSDMGSFGDFCVCIQTKFVRHITFAQLRIIIIITSHRLLSGDVLLFCVSFSLLLHHPDCCRVIYCYSTLLFHYYYITPTAVGWCIVILRFLFTIITSPRLLSGDVLLFYVSFSQILHHPDCCRVMHCYFTFPFHCHAYIIFSLFHHFFSWSVISVIGVFGLFSCDSRFMVHIESPWFVKFSKMANINFCESWFGFFLN